MSQKVKLQISSDLEDVTRVSSVLMEEALIYVEDLRGLISTAKKMLRDCDLSNEEEIQKLKSALQLINSTRVCMSKIDNRLGDVAAIVDGLERVLTARPEAQEEAKEQTDDNIVTG
jgi:ElaB/YqjD/DUF883 family membrane-anchored ribosome-binding protein